jgi:DNA repair exonuclease SbcCD ATPase subunit
MPPNTNLDSINDITTDSQPIIKEPSLCLECQNRESNPPPNIDNSVLIEEKENLVKEKDQLLSTLEECRKSLGQQNFINQKLLGEIKSLKVKLDDENNNYNMSLSKIQVLESQNTSQSSVHEELKDNNQKLMDERDRAVQEVKKLKKAITEMSAVHKDIINTSTNLDQSRDQAQTNLEELQDKYDVLLKENKRLLFRLRATESHPPEPPLKSLPTSSINTGSSFEREELARVKSELDTTLQRVRTLTSDLKAMRQQNQSLSDTLENIRSQTSSVNGPPGTSLVSIDSKLYNEIVSNLELESRNHDLLIAIQKELQARGDPDYKLSEAREMRDDAVAHANQLIELNERQASLIRTLMEKLTQMEQVRSPTRNLSPNGNLTDNIYDARTALMVVENEQLKRDLSFKDQKLQELVTKLVVMEASKPSFWAKGRSKDKQKILVHQVQSLESKLRLVERENSQLRYINRLTRGSPAPPVPPKPNSSGVESNDDISLYDSSSSNLLAAKHKSLPPNASEGSGYQFNHQSTIPQHASEGSGYRFNESVITDRSINSQFGIQHIK